jgi:hypothetical protein
LKIIEIYRAKIRMPNQRISIDRAVEIHRQVQSILNPQPLEIGTTNTATPIATNAPFLCKNTLAKVVPNIFNFSLRQDENTKTIRRIAELAATIKNKNSRFRGLMHSMEQYPDQQENIKLENYPFLKAYFNTLDEFLDLYTYISHINQSILNPLREMIQSEFNLLREL